MGGVGPGLKSAILIGFALLTAACGLETYPYLSAPQPGSSGTGMFFFTKTTENSELEFRGFELYYKLYQLSESTESNITDQGTLIARGFHRLCSSQEIGGNYERPLLPIPTADRDKEISVTVNFNILQEPVITTIPELSDPVLNFTLRRDMIDSDNYFKKFEKESFEVGDTDVRAEVLQNILDGGQVQLALYVLSFGKKELIQDIYSVAVYLGAINITFP